MSGFSNHLAQAIINQYFRNQPVAGPSAHYLALAVADPTDVTATALSNEVSGAWYARQVIQFEAPSDGTDVDTSNTAQILYNPVTGSSVTVSHWMLFDALTGGNLLASGELTVTKTLNVDDVFVVNAGELDLTLF